MNVIHCKDAVPQERNGHRQCWSWPNVQLVLCEPRLTPPSPYLEYKGEVLHTWRDALSPEAAWPLMTLLLLEHDVICAPLDGVSTKLSLPELGLS